MKTVLFFALFTLCILNACGDRSKPAKSSMDNMKRIDNHKLIIYQMMVRHFGNTNTTNKFYGSIEENGTGKFNDISAKALNELKKLGVTHLWFTGVIEHATMTDYSAYGIKVDDPDIVKGRAGSPYAIKDYYDVDPDLAVDVKKRMTEFEALVTRTHKQGLKVIMDFVPNHVARTYNSDAKPAGVKDFGEEDDRTKAFSPLNDFYYIPGKSFVVPAGTDAGGKNFKSPLKDLLFDENPAKATGNNIFSANPGLGDWSETIKLNYGIDYQNNEKKYLDPIPPVWLKMKDILSFWAKKDVDGLRCDMSEMVPVEFWNWVIPQIKTLRPGIIFIAEVYNPKLYKEYITVGKFDYLYDKVGLYDGLRKLIKNESEANVKDISYVVNEESKDFPDHMLRFLENHDEERIASEGFAKDPEYALPAMIVSATLSGGPVMIYSGQEVGEPGRGNEGFGGEDNRTSIFDYWGVPEHQKWMNGGAFDGALLAEKQKQLRSFYANLFHACSRSEAISKGKFYELKNQAGFTNRMYAYIRYTGNERVLVVANFDREKSLETTIQLPEELIKGLATEQIELTDMLSGETRHVTSIKQGITLKLTPVQAKMFRF